MNPTAFRKLGLIILAASSSVSPLVFVAAAVDLAAGSRADAEAFVKQVEAASPGFVVRAASGSVYSLTIPSQLASNEALGRITGLPDLAEIKVLIQSSGEGLTPDGLGRLQTLTNLDTLHLECAVVLKPGMLRTACQLTRLRTLVLNRALPPAEEYSSLTNLVYLKTLALYGVPNFGDVELQGLARLPLLKQLTLSQAHVSEAWTAIVGRFPSLTNATLWNDGESRSWAKMPGL